MVLVKIAQNFKTAGMNSIFRQLLVFIISIQFFSSQAQLQTFEVTPVQEVNSAVYEIHPVLHPSGEMIFFERANHIRNIKGSQDEGDIWYAKKDSSGWSKPINLGIDINNNFRNSILGFIGGGKYMLISQQYGVSNINAPNGISISEFTNGKWAKPINLSIPYFRKRSGYISGNVSADGKYITLAMESTASYGVEDIYVAVIEPNGDIGKLTNLGKSINTPFQELSAFLLPDNKHLVFSSNGHDGKGSFDLFISERLDETWKNWSKPINLSGINTEGSERDFFLLPGDDYAYYSSTTNSDGYGDIKRVKISKDSIVQQIDSVIQEMPGFRVVNGVVRDAKTGQGVNASIQLTVEDTNTDKSISTNDDGQFKFSLPDESFVSILADKKGYLPYEEKLNLLDLEDSVWTIQLEPLIIGNIIELSNVLFERASDKFLSGSESQLNLMVRMMNENPEVMIFLSGHTDNTGNKAANIKLSQDRVDAVKQYLVDNGVEAKRISGKGFGGTKPIASNADEETRKLNRRVEFEVVEP